MSLPFIGRKQELQALRKLLKKRAASLVVVQGRRRIGKSRLIEEFAKKHPFYIFTGLPPTPTATAQSQRDEFARQLSQQTHLPEVYGDDWSKLFLLLWNQVQKGRCIILLDEISWMGSKDPDFLGKLKNAWDLHFKQNSELMLVLCGSASAWIERNILSSTGFLGRISYKIVLDELSLSECNLFWESTKHAVSDYEKLKILSVTGGVPRYLEEIKTGLSAEENIRDLCFTRGGPLVDEFETIFSDLFSVKAPTYKKIVQTLSQGPQEIKGICELLKVQPTGFISDCLEDLVKSGFITRDYTWHIKSGIFSRLSHFRLSDNYLRFYLKYIDPNKMRIETNAFAFRSLASLSGWEAMMGLQFENLVLKNRKNIQQCLHIKADEIISDNPFFQRATARHPGCQIDYMIQTRFGVLYLCEIKFSKTVIPLTILNEMKKKMERLQYPKGFSCKPVLIHVNGVHEDLEESGFFAEIVDFTEFLHPIR